MRISLEILRWSWRRVSWWEFLWKFSGEVDEELADENFFGNSQGEAEEDKIENVNKFFSVFRWRSSMSDQFEAGGSVGRPRMLGHFAFSDQSENRGNGIKFPKSTRNSKQCAAVRMALGSREGQICGSNLYERLLAFPVWPCDVSVCKWETCTAVGQMESSVRAGRLGASIPMRMREHQNLVQALLGTCFRLCGCSSLRCFVVLWALAWF